MIWNTSCKVKNIACVNLTLSSNGHIERVVGKLISEAYCM